MRNEFAAVRLHVDVTANAPRLVLHDLETGARRAVDAFVLRSLALAPEELLLQLCRAAVPSDEPVRPPARRRAR